MLRAQTTVSHLASGEFPPSKKVNSEKHGKFKKLQCINGSSMRCEKVIVTFNKKQHTSGEWTEAVQKLLNTDQRKHFGICTAMEATSEIFIFTITYTFISLFKYTAATC